VSDRDAIPKPLDAVLRAIGGPGDDERASTFARGLALGALVGAAIAGSTIWQRRHVRAPREADPASGAVGGPAESSEELSPPSRA
jgi:hypothetical protein